MGAGIILQARLTSSRFPNKVLCPLMGKPVIQWCIEEVVKTELPWVLAIPSNKTDLGLNEWCKEYSIRTNTRIRTCFGHREDLIMRFKEALDVVNYDPIIRICGDSPFFSHKDVEIALKLFKERGYFTQLNHIQVFSRHELEYASDHDFHINSREHAGTRFMSHTVDFPEDIERIELEFKKNSPTFKGRLDFRNAT